MLVDEVRADLRFRVLELAARVAAPVPSVAGRVPPDDRFVDVGERGAALGTDDADGGSESRRSPRATTGGLRGFRRVRLALRPARRFCCIVQGGPPLVRILTLGITTAMARNGGLGLTEGLALLGHMVAVVTGPPTVSLNYGCLFIPVGGYDVSFRKPICSCNTRRIWCRG